MNQAEPSIVFDIRNACLGKSCRRSRGSRGGVAATELAIVLPLLITVGMVSVDLCRFAHAHIVLGNAARVGAQYGASHQFTSYTYSAWEDSVQSVIVEEMDHLRGFDSEQMTLQIDTSAESYSLSRVSVTVEYPFTPIVKWLDMTTVPMRRQVIMRQYR